MKTINILPDWYVQQQKQKRNLRVHMCIMMVLGAGIVVSMGLARTKLASAEVRREQLVEQAKQIGNPRERLSAQSAELTRLKNLQNAYKELGNTVPMSAVIQQIQNDMSAGMALSRVEVDVHPEPVKGSSFVGSSTPPKLRDVAHLTVVGISSNDVYIAQLIGKLSTNPLFSNVSLNYTRSETLRDRFVRRFEIQLQMDLELLSVEDPEGSSPASTSATHASQQGAGQNAG
jgi:hypothetical protein